MKIGNFEIGNKCFIIAELSANHNGCIDTAIKTIHAAKEAGADAIKLQTYTPDTITMNIKSNDFKIQGTVWDGKYLYDLYNEAYTPWEWHKELFSVAKKIGLEIFSSPFDNTAVDFLEKLNVPAYKIASFEITDIPLIRYVAKKAKPIILSTGIATKEDIELALREIKKAGNHDIILLKCTSSYPAPLIDANLSMIHRFKEDYQVVVGLSDHTLGITAPVVATALGAKVIEKHFILDKSLGGPDAGFSLDPNEFKQMVEAVRNAECSLGSEDYTPNEKILKSRVFSRSLYFNKNLKAGDIINSDSFRSIRPGHGLHPKHSDSIIGKTVKVDIKKGDRVSWSVIN